MACTGSLGVSKEQPSQDHLVSVSLKLSLDHLKQNEAVIFFFEYFVVIPVVLESRYTCGVIYNSIVVDLELTGNVIMMIDIDNEYQRLVNTTAPDVTHSHCCRDCR